MFGGGLVLYGLTHKVLVYLSHKEFRFYKIFGGTLDTIERTEPCFRMKFTSKLFLDLMVC